MAARTGDEAIGGGVSGGKPTEEASAQVIDGFAAFLGGDALIVPAGFDLLHADFARSGHDLVLTAPDGAQLVITDYFALPLQADLATADGAVLPAATVAALAGPQAPGQYAQAGANDAAGQQIIGEVKTIEGRVVITRADGTVIEAEIGTQIYAQDVVETTLSGGIGILFVDDTSFALGGNARMVMDKFVFDPATASNSGVLTVVQGAFSFVSGQVAKSGDDALTIETPTLTIGVRGTSVIGKAAAEGAETRVALVRDPDGTLGKIYVFNDMDAYLIEEENLSVSGVGRNEILTLPQKLTRDQLEELGGVALRLLPDQEGQNYLRDDDDVGADDSGGGGSIFAAEDGTLVVLRASDPYQSRGTPGEGSPDTQGEPVPTGLIIPAESGTNERVYGGDGRILAEQGTFSTSGPGGLNASSPIITPASGPGPLSQNDSPPGGLPRGPSLNTDTSTFTDNDDPFGGVSPFPVISGPRSVSFDEAGGTAVAVYTIQNDSGTPAFLSIAPGGDADAFTLISGFAFISGPVVLSFFEAPDFENPADADGDNVYVVTLLADDGQGHTETITVSVAVDDVDESPTSNSPSAIDVAENTDFVGVFTATAFSGDPADVTLGSGDDSALFAFDSGTNTLTFLTRPDFEAPSDSDQDNTYIVNLNADDGVGNQGSFAVTVNVTDVSAPVVIFAPNGPTVNENGTLVSGTFTAEDESGNPVDITIDDTVDAAALGAPDGAFFTLDNSTGQLSFIAPPDFENPQDAATNNGPTPGAADNEYVLLLRAENAAGDVASQIVTVQVQNVNEAPFFVGNPTGLAFSTNEGQQDAFTAAATDPDGTTPTYSLSGDDAHLFEAVSPGGSSFRFAAPPNFESFADDDNDNIFDVVLEVSDGEFVATLPVEITLQNVAPDFGAAPALVELDENNQAVGTFAATDPASTNHTYSLFGGADDGLFSFDANSGLLSFNAAPNFENAGDVGGDNDYQVRIVADDGAGGVTAHALTVRVLDVNEAPFATVTSFTTAEEQREALDIAPQDDEGENIVVTIVGGVADGALFEVIGGQLFFRSAPSFENPQGGGSSNQYDVTLNLFDGTNNAHVPVTIDVTNVEEAPLFDNAAAISVAEGTAGNLGVSATDPDTENKATLTIIGGDDRFQGEGGPTFAIVNNALQFVIPPDFESPTDLGRDNTYEVILRAEDAAGQITDQTLVLTVTNVVEDPFAQQTSFTTDEEQPGAFDVMPVGDAGGKVTVSVIGGPDADDEGAPRFVVNDNVISFINAPDFENPVDGGATPDNVYDLIVRLTQDGRNVDVPISITVLPVNEAPELVGSPAFAVPEGFAGNLATFIDPDNGQEGEIFGLQRDPAAGQDIDFFAINFVDNHLLFDAPLDFENPQSADGDNVYEVTVLVDGANGGPSTQQTLLIEITNVNEAPVFVSPTAFGADEGITGGLGIFARDPDDNAPGTLSIVGGDDRFDGEGVPMFEIVDNDLRFINAPDFENPLDVGGDNTYNVVLRATDGEGLFAENAFNITVRDAVDPVVAGVTSFTVDENQSGSFDIEPTSDNAGPVTVTFLNGIDLVDGNGAPLFEITNNIISFVAPPDFEAPLDDTNVAGGGDGTPDNIYTFSILMDDGAAQNAAAITIEVLPVDEAPIPAGGSAFSVPENTVTNLTTFTDPDTGNAATIVGIDAAGGEDGDQFAVVGNVFRFASRPDFENPGDADQDREYLVTVIVDDPSAGGNVNVDLAITITEVDEPPELQSPFTYSLNENVTGGLGVQTEDPETRTPGTLTIIGGADQALFQLVNNDLEFIAVPDFENPLDSADAFGQIAGDNVYSVRLEAIDDGNQIIQFSQVITILNVDEAPVLNGSTAFSVVENSTDSLVDITDPEGAPLTLTLPESLDQGFFEIRNGNELHFINPPDFDTFANENADNIYLVSVAANDDGAVGEESTFNFQITLTNIDEPPIFTSLPPAVLDENITGGLGVVVDDPDTTDVPVLTIVDPADSPVGGQDAGLFQIVNNDLAFITPPDFENDLGFLQNGTYSVRVMATDSTGKTSTSLLSILIDNVEELPIPVGGSAFSVSENTAGSLVTFTDPDSGNTAAIVDVDPSGLEDSNRFFVIGGELRFQTPPDFESPTDANEDQEYLVTVIVSDPSLGDDVNVDLAITVTPVDEPPIALSDPTILIDENFLGFLGLDIEDPEGDNITITNIGGADGALFSNGFTDIRFTNAPNFEIPGDADTDNDYEVLLTVEDAGGNEVQFARTIRIGNLEEQPQVVGGPNITLSENHTGRVATIIDPDTGNDAQILSVGTGIGTQPDGSFFDVVANEIVFITPPDFENPVDDTDLANNGDGVPDNTYGITVFVRDTTSNVTHARDIFITVENENEPPVLQGPAAFTVQEGFTGNLATFIDPDTGLEAPYRGRLRHDTLSPDVDAFTIDNDLNELRFVSIPDFENPLDVANGAGDGAADNVYVVTVIVEDDFGGIAYEHQLTITVENVEEAPVSDKGLAFSVLENFDGELTTFTDPDTGADADIIDVFFPGEGAAPDGGLFTIDAESLQFVFKSPPDFENPLDDDGDNVYHVTVTVSDPSSGFISDVDLAITVLDVAVEPFFVSDIDGDNGFALDGGAYDEPFGSQMAFGDFDGDGFADIQITNPHDLRDVGVKTFGKVYVVYGGEDPFAGAAEIDVDGLPLSQAFVTIADDQDGLGRDVLTGVGLRDVNNDGAADSLTFVQGAAFTTDGEGQSGIEFGGQRRATDVNANDEVLGSQGLFRGGEGEEEVTLISTGDLNADGYEDFVFRGGTRNTDPNEVIIVFGDPDRFSENVLEDVAEQANTLTLTGFKGIGIVGLNNGFAVNSNIATGDINGDRIADLLISDPLGTGAGANEGEVFVVFGSDEGFASEIDVTTLDGTNGFRIHGDGTRLGDTIAYLGDINGDNIGDFAVSSIYGGPGGHGEVFVFHGSTDGFGDLVELDPNSGDPFVFDGTNGTRFQYGRTADNLDPAQFGNGLSAGGDFDGDGLDDFVIGAHYADNDAGAVFVVYGKEGGHGPVADLYNLDPTTFFRIYATPASPYDVYGSPGDRIGYNVTGGGDVNGDGLDDIGTWSYYYGASENKAYVLFGDDKQGHITHLGSNAGEVLTGDSNPNVIIGAQGNDTLDGAGGADILKGGQGDDTIFAYQDAKLIEGDSGFDIVAFKGVADEVVNLHPTAVADSLEFFGVLKEVEVLDLTEAGSTDIRIDKLAVQEITDTRNELRIIGDASDILTLGDAGWLRFDDITLDTVLFKTLRHDGTTLLVQNDIVLAGETVNLPPFFLSDLDGVNGFSIEAGYPDDFAAQMSFGDFDGDGFADMQFTNPDYDRIPGATNAGKTYVVYGGEDPFSGAAQVDIDDLGLDQAFTTVADDQGVNAEELSGVGLRDVNNDGFADALTFVRDGRGASGIEFGGQRQPHHANIHAEALGFQGLFEGLEGSRETTLATTGDLNADGYEDYIFRTGDGVGEGENEVIIVFGDPTFFSQEVIEKVPSEGAASITLTGFDAYGSVGLRTGTIDMHTMATGDINGDRIDDLIIADHKTGTDRAGHVYVVFGDGTGFAGDIDVTTLDGTDGFRIEGERYTGLGQAIDFVGDVNGDNIGDFVVAAPYGFGNGYAYLVLGSDDPFDAVIDLETNPNYFDGTNGTRFEYSAGNGAYFGLSVAGAGDVDGDGLSDLVIGAPYAGGDYDPGAVYIVYGDEAGLGASFDVSTPNNATHFTVQGLSYDRAGYTVAGGADINGDGFDDIGTWGYYYGNSGGGAFIVFGADRRGNVQNSGTSGDDSIFGDGSNATIIGGAGNDDIWGNGADVLLGGQGDDWFIATTGIDKIDGGTGTDTAKFIGIGATINLLPGFLGGDVLEFYGILQDIEIVDIDRSIDTNLRLDALAVQQVTDSGNELRVTGDVGDSVTLVDAGWEQVRLVTIDNVDYQELRHGGQSLLVDADLTLAGIAPTNQAPFYAVGEPPAPLQPNPFSFSVDEGLAAIIPDIGYDPEGGDIRYQVMGDDKELFVKTSRFATPPDIINTRGQTLKLNTPFDFEVPTDVGADGTYNVTVRVEDDFGLFTDHEFIFTVNDVVEAPIDVDLATINGTNGFIIEGANTGSLDSTGISFAGGQDFNDDGIADVVIVNHRYDAGAGRDYGEAIVVYGYNTAPAILADGVITRNEVFGSGGADGFVTRAPDTDDLMLHAQLVGDMDGDGRSELALGLVGGDRAVSGNKFTTEGELYLLTGGNGFNQTNSPPFGAGIRLVGAEEGDALGWSIGGPGDFNGDGYNDLVVTADAQHSTPDDHRSGEIYVIYGHENGVRGEFIDGRYSLDLSDLDGGNGFSITTYFQSELGENVAFGGDINGDGRDDLIASGLRRLADLDDDGIDELDVEGALIYWGSDQPQPVVNDALNLQSGQSSLVLMDASADFVTAGGDMNGDGYGDFVVSMSRFGGKAFVVFGAADMPDIIDPGQVLNETGEVEGFVISGIDSAAVFEAMSFGDMNGDGFDDLIIAETSIGAANDRFYVIYGSDEQFDTQFNLVSMKRSSSSTSKDGLIIQSDSNSGARGIDQIGFADVNNDGFDDALLGAPNDNKGYVLFGDATGAVADVVRGTTGADTLTVANGRHAVFGMDDRDIIEVTLGSFSNTFRLVDGGTGEDSFGFRASDTLAVQNGGNIDLGDGNHQIKNIEIIDLTNTEANEVYLTPQLVAGMSPEFDFITIVGDEAGGLDSVVSYDQWVSLGSVIFGGPDGENLSGYRSGDTYLFIETGIDVSTFDLVDFGLELGLNGSGFVQFDAAPVDDGPLTIMLYAAVDDGAAANDAMALFSIGAVGGGDLLTFGLDTFGANALDVDFEGQSAGVQARVGDAPQTDENVWHHYAVVLDDTNEDGFYSSDEVAIYFDGQRILDTFVSGTEVIDFSEGTSFVLGAEILTNDGSAFADAENLFDGSIDDVAIFDRALTAAEIAAYAGSVKPLDYHEDDLVDYYSFDDGTLNDQSFSSAGSGNGSAVGTGHGFFNSSVADLPGTA